MTNDTLAQKVQTAVNEGANVIQALRQSLGYSLDDLAVACGLTSDEIALIEGGASIDEDKLARIISAVGMAPETFNRINSSSSSAA